MPKPAQLYCSPESQERLLGLCQEGTATPACPQCGSVVLHLIEILAYCLQCASNSLRRKTSITSGQQQTALRLSFWQ